MPCPLPRDRAEKECRDDDRGNDQCDDDQEPAGALTAPALVPAGFGYEDFGRRRRPGRFCLHSATMYSIMLRVKVDRSEALALHDQVAAEIRRAIAAGEASPGERLPPAKDLAAVLGVNANTVFRALRLLRDEGLLEFKRGRGVTVAGSPERGAVIERTKQLLEFARFNGYRKEDVMEILGELQ